MERDRGRIAQALRWFFVDRTTGRIVVAQWPNWSLWIFIVAFVAAAILKQADSAFARSVAIVAAVVLAIWALDEIVRGCNPFRRALGVVVLVVLALRWLTP